MDQVRVAIFDVDRTLFDTKRFRHALFSCLEPTISHDQVLELYEQQKPAGAVSNFDYDIMAHIEAIARVFTNVTFAKVATCMFACIAQAELFLFDGAYRALAEIKMSGFKIVLQSRGSLFFQAEKINNLSIRTLADEIIVSPEGKNRIWRQKVTEWGVAPGSMWFVNDHTGELKMAHQMYREAHCICIIDPAMRIASFVEVSSFAQVTSSMSEMAAMILGRVYP